MTTAAYIRRPPRLSGRPRHERSVRPVAECVEDRVLLSIDIFTVDSTGGTTAGTGTSGSLPYVIALANADTNRDGSEIKFDGAVFSTSLPSTITLANTLVLSETSGPEVIDEPAAGAVTVSGGHSVEVFDVDSGVEATISGLCITGGSATRGAGVLSYGNLTLTDCTITGNSAQGGTTSNTGGGALLSFGPATLTDCKISDNSAFDGGGLDDFNATTLTGCTISGDSAKNGGGGIMIDTGTTKLYDCTLGSNSAQGGGGLSNDYGTADLTGCTITANSAETGGAGLINLRSSSSVTLTACTISDNSTPAAPSLGGGDSAVGGGLDNFGSATLTDCTISNNYAQGGGGGLENFGELALTNCTLSGNASQNGAGLFNDTGIAVLTDCTLEGNSAAIRGGGLSNDYATATLTSCTISGNSAGDGIGGGVDNIRSGQTVTLTDTIVANNFGTNWSADDIYNFGNMSGSYDLIGDGGAGGLTNGANHIIVLASLGTLLLGPLQNNGGPTDTMALLPDSRAIGAGIEVDYPGTTTPITTDERGEPLDSPTDIGAYQVQQPTVTTGSATDVTPTSATLNASVNPENSTEPIFWFDYGTSQTLATSTPTQDQTISTGSVPVTATATLTGLAPDTTYYYQVVLKYSGGEVAGLTASLTTPVVGPPTSAVFTMPATTANTSFTVSWSGSPGPGATSIASYTIYDSDDGGPFTAFLANTTLTSATFTGQFGHTYAFYSVATDNFGNVQPIPTAAQATTRVVAPIATKTTVTSSENPAPASDRVTLTATVSAAQSTNGVPSGTIQFVIDGAPTGSPVALVNGSASLTAPTLPPRVHTVTALYSPENGLFTNGTGSLPGGESVTGSTTTALSSSLSSAVFGQSVTFTAVISAQAAGGPTPSGNVSFLDGSTVLGIVLLNAGTAQFRTSGLAIGSHSIKVVYEGNGTYTGSQSGSMVLPVQSDGVTILVTPSANPSPPSHQLTLTAAVNAAAPGSGIPTGTVTLYDGKKSLGTVAIDRGVAMLTTKKWKRGSQTITVIYHGDSEFTGATSGVLRELIQQPSKRKKSKARVQIARPALQRVAVLALQPSMGLIRSSPIAEMALEAVTYEDEMSAGWRAERHDESRLN
jgi:hypothetical protein